MKPWPKITVIKKKKEIINDEKICFMRITIDVALQERLERKMMSGYIRVVYLSSILHHHH